MSLWTPGGEHPVEKDSPRSAEPQPPLDEGPSYDDLSPEEQAQVRAMAEEMEAVRAQLASVPASTVVANHAMGLYELAAIHLTREPPDFVQASLAIDGMGAIIDGLAGRLEEPEATLREALGQIRQAYVAMRSEHA